MKSNAGEQDQPIITEAIVPADIPMSLSRPPEIVLEEAQRAAKALAEVISNKKRKVVFQGEQYLEFEDWLTVARFYNVSVRVDRTAYVEYGESRGFEAHASAILNSTSQTISAAEALCLDDERNWTGKPLFQLRSMAQTRACAKALRTALSWVVVLAGYRPTPAEEMGSDMAGGHEPIKQPTRISMRSQPSAVSDPAPATAAAPAESAGTLNKNQIGKLWATARQNGWREAEVKLIVQRHGVEHTKDIRVEDFSAVLDELSTPPRHN